MTPYFMVLIAVAGLVATAYNHYNLFGEEYKYMPFFDKAKSFAPTVLIGMVVLFAIGYILFLFGSKGGSASLPSISRRIPPPSTSTNILTNGIGNGLKRLGLVDDDRSASRNNALSISPSLENNIGSTTRRRVEESRWKRAV
jgi:hypothetical protein